MKLEYLCACYRKELVCVCSSWCVCVCCSSDYLSTYYLKPLDAYTEQQLKPLRAQALAFVLNLYLLYSVLSRLRLLPYYTFTWFT